MACAGLGGSPRARADAGPSQPNPRPLESAVEARRDVPAFLPALRARTRLSERLRSRLRDQIESTSVLHRGSDDSRDEATTEPGSPGATGPDWPAGEESPRPEQSAPADEAVAPSRRLYTYVTKDGVTVLSNRAAAANPKIEVPPARVSPEELRRGAPEGVAPATTEARPLRTAQAAVPADIDSGLGIQLGLMLLIALGLALTGLLLWRKNRRT